MNEQIEFEDVVYPHDSFQLVFVTIRCVFEDNHFN